jgi:ABC-2 type transport system permease protein
VTLRIPLAIARRELLSLFVSPVATIVLFAFLLVHGATFYFYLRALDGELPAVLASQFGGVPFWFLCLSIPPLITMRSIAEERRAGTFELLVSTGAGDAEIIAGKFLAAWCFHTVLWLSVLPLLVLADRAGGVDWGVVISLYTGLVLIGALFTAVGVLASAVTQNPLVAAVLGVTANLAIFFLNWLRVLHPPGALEIRYFEYLSPVHHFGNDFSQGVVDLRVAVLYIGTALWALFLSVKALERRRWS